MAPNAPVLAPNGGGGAAPVVPVAPFIGVFPNAPPPNPPDVPNVLDAAPESLAPVDGAPKLKGNTLLDEGPLAPDPFFFGPPNIDPEDGAGAGATAGLAPVNPPDDGGGSTGVVVVIPDPKPNLLVGPVVVGFVGPSAGIDEKVRLFAGVVVTAVPDEGFFVGIEKKSVDVSFLVGVVVEAPNGLEGEAGVLPLGTVPKNDVEEVAASC